MISVVVQIFCGCRSSRRDVVFHGVPKVRSIPKMHSFKPTCNCIWAALVWTVKPGRVLVKEGCVFFAGDSLSIY